jgi:hypothetical protein
MATAMVSVVCLITLTAVTSALLLYVLLHRVSCCCRQGLVRGMPTMMYYMARHGLSGRMGWGPKYTVVMLQHQADKGLDKVCMHNSKYTFPDHNRLTAMP